MTQRDRDLLEPLRVAAAAAIDVGAAIVPAALVVARCVGAIVVRL